MKAAAVVFEWSKTLHGLIFSVVFDLMLWFNNVLRVCGLLIFVLQQEQEAEAAGGVAPNDLTEEKLPGSGSEDSDDENSDVCMITN